MEITPINNKVEMVKITIDDDKILIVDNVVDRIMTKILVLNNKMMGKKFIRIGFEFGLLNGKSLALPPMSNSKMKIKDLAVNNANDLIVGKFTRLIRVISLLPVYRRRRNTNASHSGAENEERMYEILLYTRFEILYLFRTTSKTKR